MKGQRHAFGFYGIIGLAFLLCGGCYTPPQTQRSQCVGTWKLAALDAPASLAPQPIYLALFTGGTCSYNRHFAAGDFKTAVQSDHRWYFTNGAIYIYLADFVRTTNPVASWSRPGRVQGDKLIFEADPFVSPFTYRSHYKRLPDREAGSIWVTPPRMVVGDTNWAENAWRQRVDAVIEAEGRGEAPPKRHTTWAAYWKERVFNIDAMKKEGKVPPILGTASMVEGMLPYIQSKRKALGLPPFD